MLSSLIRMKEKCSKLEIFLVRQRDWFSMRSWIDLKKKHKTSFKLQLRFQVCNSPYEGMFPWIPLHSHQFLIIALGWELIHAFLVTVTSYCYQLLLYIYILSATQILKTISMYHDSVGCYTFWCVIDHLRLNWPHSDAWEFRWGAGRAGVSPCGFSCFGGSLGRTACKKGQSWMHTYQDSPPSSLAGVPLTEARQKAVLRFKSWRRRWHHLVGETAVTLQMAVYTRR